MTRLSEPWKLTTDPKRKLDCYTTGIAHADNAKLRALCEKVVAHFAAPVADASHIVGAPAPGQPSPVELAQDEAGAANHHD